MAGVEQGGCRHCSEPRCDLPNSTFVVALLLAMESRRAIPRHIHPFFFFFFLSFSFSFSEDVSPQRLSWRAIPRSECSTSPPLPPKPGCQPAFCALLFNPKLPHFKYSRQKLQLVPLPQGEWQPCWEKNILCQSVFAAVARSLTSMIALNCIVNSPQHVSPRLSIAHSISQSLPGKPGRREQAGSKRKS